MDPLIAGALITAAASVVAGVLAWHAATANARTNARNAAQEAAERALEEAREETARERRELLELRDARLEEMANQLGSARMALADERQRRKDAETEIENLRRRLAEPGDDPE